GEALAGLELCGRSGGTEGAPASSREFVYYAQHKREFRPDDGEVRLNPVAERDHRVEALYVDRKALRLIRDTAVARRAVDFRGAGRLPELPNQGMLASAAADDEDLHSRDIQGQGRKKTMSNGERGRKQIAEGRGQIAE